MVGLGKMGGFMTERLIQGGHRVVGYDRDAAVVQKTAEKGAQGEEKERHIKKYGRATSQRYWRDEPIGEKSDPMKVK